ncbi:MAG TPA: aminotransferase class III-fold pyridoxal phosphate-dependent enzyme [Vicinamibacterales bacterium]|nr:aminotransferase class III-fold pyridoxal phosphate-dependent enzyme [Vicinamibacterales bacterium]
MPTFFAHPPDVSENAAQRLGRDLYGLDAVAAALPSERDRNFRLDTPDGARYVLKIANAREPTGMLEAENAAMRHLAATRLTPVLVPTRDGGDIGVSDGHRVRLIEWIDGQPLAVARARTSGLLESVGSAVAVIDLSLKSFDHPALHREFHWDLAAASATIARELPRVADPDLRRAIEHFLSLHQSSVVPRLPTLARSVIHNDANDHNVLVDGRTDRVVGIVDFGDMVFTQTVNGLAVAMAYAALGEGRPLIAAATVARGYHAVRPLADDELAVLFPLMGLRLCVSVAVACVQQAERPGDEYLGVSQRAIREALPRLADIHPRLAHYILRDACGVTPVPATGRVVNWLRANAGHFAPLTGHDLRRTPVLGLDLSVGSPLVSSDPAQNEPEPLTRRIFEAMRESGVEIAAGGYDEARVLYATDAYESEPTLDQQPLSRPRSPALDSQERRTVHLGIDVTLAAGSPLYAPLDGVVHGFMDAAGRLDYGPMIVLRHDVRDADGPLTFYTLYGHLERESLDRLVVGKRIAAGESFAAIGAPPWNGGWWPHVHFQVIVDMLDVPCNFNGVAPQSERGVWLSLCPDPNLLLGIPPERFARHPPASELLATRRQRFGGNLSLSYGLRPLQLARGWMQYVFDETGRRYIDAYNNVPHVGHSHPSVVRAASAQLATLNTNTRYLQEVVVEYATALTECFPPPLRVCYFTASGSEANELALRLARAFTGARDVIVMDAAYHGHTTTLIDISPYKHGGPGGSGAPDWVHTSPVPDVYRGRHGAADSEAGVMYARQVGEVIDTVLGRGGRLCGYIAETCPSVGGQIMLPEGFLPEVYRLVRAAGGVAIADEVQTGFGRIGTHFWAFERQGVVPDIVVLGKPIANGYPLGAVVTTRAVADAFDNGMEFFSTFGGSTAACAAGLATLRATVSEGLQAHALAVGKHLLTGLRRLQDGYDLVGDVRGSGLFIGVELVRDRRTLEPAPAEAATVVNRMRDFGVLTGTDGPHHNVIKIRGPMPLTISDADCVVDALARALGSV